MNKKGQIDVALTIGSIVIPIVVLLGALIFSWAMISTTTNAGRVAGIVAHDMTTMVDLVYSVPDDITIKYKPLTVCKFASEEDPTISKDYLTCFRGFMNFTSEITLETTTVSTQFPVIDTGTGQIKKHYTETINEGHFGGAGSDVLTFVNYPYRSLLKTGIIFSSEVGVEDKEYDLEYSAFANPMDFGLIKEGTTLQIKNQAINFEKTRIGFSDTLVDMDTATVDLSDPLEKIIFNSNSVCKSGTEKEFTIQLKPGFFIRNEVEDELCLMKARINPNLNWYIEQWKGNNKPEYEESTIYCFNFSKIPGGCTYDLTLFNTQKWVDGVSSENIPNPLYNPATREGSKETVTITKTGTQLSFTSNTEESIV